MGWPLLLQWVQCLLLSMLHARPSSSTDLVSTLSPAAAAVPWIMVFWLEDTALMPKTETTGSSRTPGELDGVRPDTSRWLATRATSAELPPRLPTQLFKPLLPHGISG